MRRVAEARRLDCRYVQGSAQFVDNQSCQCFAFHLLADDEQRLAAPSGLLQQREQVFHAADLLFMNEDQGILEHAFHGFRVGHEIGRQISAIELHAFDYFQFGLEGLAFLDGDHAVFADLVHCFGDDIADRRIVVGRNGGHLRNLFALDRLSRGKQGFDNRRRGLFDAALDFHRVGARSDAFQPVTVNRLGEYCRRCRPIAGYVACLGSDLAKHLCAHVLEFVFELNLFGNCYTVLRYGRTAELLFEHNVAALGAQRDSNGIGQLVHAGQNCFPAIFSKYNLFTCHLGSSSLRCCG